MSAEHQGPSLDLKEIMAETVGQLAEQSKLLSTAVTDTVNNDRSEISVQELAAAFHFIERIGAIGRDLVEARGDIIFEDGQIPQATPAPLIEAAVVEEAAEAEDKPKTFRDLLLSKIDKFLEPGQPFFEKQEIFKIIGRQSALRVMRGLDFPKNRRKFTRNETIEVYHRVLITPYGNLKKKNSLYSEQEIKSSFFQERNRQLNELSAEIGFDWQQTPSVDFENAMELRGLAQLAKLAYKKLQAT